MRRLFGVWIACSVFLWVPAPEALPLDFAAVGLSLNPTGSGTYDVVPKVGLRLGTPGPVSLTYRLLVNGTLAASRSEPVGIATLCEGPGCEGVCRVYSGGQYHDGLCVEFLTCHCVTLNAPLPALSSVSIPPGATCKLVLDPDGELEEEDESNNTYTLQMQTVPTLGKAGRFLLAGLFVLLFTRRRHRRTPIAG